MDQRLPICWTWEGLQLTVVDILIRSGDICDQSLKLYVILASCAPANYHARWPTNVNCTVLLIYNRIVNTLTDERLPNGVFVMLQAARASHYAAAAASTRLTGLCEYFQNLIEYSTDTEISYSYRVVLNERAS